MGAVGYFVKLSMTLPTPHLLTQPTRWIAPFFRFPPNGEIREPSEPNLRNNINKLKREAD